MTLKCVRGFVSQLSCYTGTAVLAEQRAATSARRTNQVTFTERKHDTGLRGGLHACPGVGHVAASHSQLNNNIQQRLRAQRQMSMCKYHTPESAARAPGIEWISRINEP